MHGAAARGTRPRPPAGRAPGGLLLEPPAPPRARPAAPARPAPRLPAQVDHYAKRLQYKSLQPREATPEEANPYDWCARQQLALLRATNALGYTHSGLLEAVSACLMPTAWAASPETLAYLLYELARAGVRSSALAAQLGEARINPQLAGMSLRQMAAALWGCTQMGGPPGAPAPAPAHGWLVLWAARRRRAALLPPAATQRQPQGPPPAWCLQGARRCGGATGRRAPAPGAPDAARRRPAARPPAGNDNGPLARAVRDRLKERPEQLTAFGVALLPAAMAAEPKWFDQGAYEVVLDKAGLVLEQLQGEDALQGLLLALAKSGLQRPELAARVRQLAQERGWEGVAAAAASARA